MSILVLLDEIDPIVYPLAYWGLKEDGAMSRRLVHLCCCVSEDEVERMRSIVCLDLEQTSLIWWGPVARAGSLQENPNAHLLI